MPTTRPAGSRPDRYPPPVSTRDRVAGARDLLSRPGWVLMPARLFLGGTFLFAGLQKLASRAFFDPSSPTSIAAQLKTFHTDSPIGALLGPLVGHATTVGVLTALGEVAVGIGTLLGLWARVAAFGGLLLSLSFFLTVSFHTRPYYYGSDIFAIVAWLPFVAVGAAGVWSLDGWLRARAGRDLGVDPADPPADRRADLDRRTVVRGAAVAGVTAVGAGVLAGADTLIGRSRSVSSPAAASGAGASPSASAAASPSAPATAGGSGGGTVVGKLADLPVGGSLKFTDPASGKAAYAVRPASGDVKAFSAICTHAGCAVNWNTSSGDFICPCHGSSFDGKTGDVVTGPAVKPLPSIGVSVAGGEIRTTD